MTYEDYVEKKLFAPLGMTRSMYCNGAENVARRAHGYMVQNGAVRRAPTNVHTWPFAAGSLCSTAGDLVVWLKALHGGKVLSPKSYAEMTTPSLRAMTSWAHAAVSTTKSWFTPSSGASWSAPCGTSRTEHENPGGRSSAPPI